MKIPLSVIGSGTNLLVGDGGIRGITVKLGRVFDYVKFKNDGIVLGGTTQIRKLLDASMRKGLGGLEFLFGLPGSMGGAVIGNAGFPRKSIGDFVDYVKIIDFSGRNTIIKKKCLKFYYRGSSLKGRKLIITEVKISGFKNTDPDVINERKKLVLSWRRMAQPIELPSSGCIFKNPVLAPAGLLVDLAGLRGIRSGGAFVSGKHANFIVNCGNSKAKDITKLIDIIRKKVRSLFHAKLELELQKIGVFK